MPSCSNGRIWLANDEYLPTLKCSLKLKKSLKASTDKQAQAADRYFTEQGKQGVSTYLENGSTESQVRDVGNHFA